MKNALAYSKKMHFAVMIDTLNKLEEMKAAAEPILQHARLLYENAKPNTAKIVRATTCRPIMVSEHRAILDGREVGIETAVAAAYWDIINEPSPIVESCMAMPLGTKLTAATDVYNHLGPNASDHIFMHAAKRLLAAVDTITTACETNKRKATPAALPESQRAKTSA